MIKEEIVEQIEILEAEQTTLKTERKTTEKHIKVIDLPEEESFQALFSSKKHLVDTIKMIAYRADADNGQHYLERMRNT